MEELTSVKEILDKTGKYTGLTKGVSMRPMLHQGRDNIIVVKNTQRLKKYDVAVYLLKSGKYVMHRVIEVYDDHYIFMGDNLKMREYVTDDMICGKLVGYFKKGKRYIDCEDNKLYKFYSKLVVSLIPIRPITNH
ncbi:MAG TPA: hypothetical protein DCZ02_04650, partial [Ruminococcaceae bacterium]|nr:hypothetical protein [Oscillospiraceae bacterium]